MVVGVGLVGEGMGGFFGGFFFASGEFREGFKRDYVFFFGDLRREVERASTV